MTIVQVFFVNPTQNRLRLIWRLGLFALLLGFLGTLSQFLPALLSVLAHPGTISLTLAALSLLGAAAATTASVYLAARFLDKRRFSDLGLKLSPRWWSDFLFGLGLGAGLMGLLFALQLGLGWIRINPLPAFQLSQTLPRTLLAILLYLSVGFYEELLNRGYLIKNLSEGFSALLSPRLAISLSTVLTSVFFGLIHAANPHATPLAILNIILAGLALAFGYLATGQLGLSIGYHISWNLVQGPLLGFPVSGSSFLSGLFFQAEQLGPALWTGGAFGPEGGLVGAIALLLGMGLIWFYKWDGIAPGLAQYQPRSPKPAKNGIIQA